MGEDEPAASLSGHESDEQAAAVAATSPPAPPEPEGERGAGGPTLRGQIAAGLALVLLGGALLVLERLDGSSSGALALVLLGAVFIAAYFYQQSYGFLIPGGILLGLGGGQIFADLYEGPMRSADGPVLGLGVGFLLIYVVSLLWERRSRWWPLIPGALLTLAGLPEFGWAEDLLDFWPVAIMAVGGVLLVRGMIAARDRAERGPR